MITTEITKLSYFTSYFVSIICKPNCNATSHLKHRLFSVVISIGSLLFFYSCFISYNNLRFHNNLLLINY